MPYFAVRPVASGRPYHVVACRGRVPSALADFEGESEFTLSTGTQTMVVSGVGSAQGDWVRFHEKDGASDGRDVRVWHITQEADGGFTAATGPSAVFTLGWPLDRSGMPPA
jgi:hypothetical protein